MRQPVTHDLDMRLGRWQTVLANVPAVDALIFDAPYSAKTHAADTMRADGFDPGNLTPSYESFDQDDVRAFCEAWAGDRCRGWMVSLTDSVLAPVWGAEMERIGRYVFAPVGCLVRGMSVRMAGDGPSSWMLYACVSRPRTREFATWGALDGGYHGAYERGAGGGRGKPSWLMRALVRDYTRPGDLVCDPFAGWGSTLAAAIGLGRRALGAELDAEAYAECRRRLSRPIQVDLFDARDGAA